MALCGRARGTRGSRKDAKTQRKPRTRLCYAWSGATTFLNSPSPPGEEKGSGDEVGKHAQFAFCELHRVREKTLEGLVLSVLVVLSEAVLVLREAVLVVSPISTLRGTVRLSSFLELCTFRTHCRPCTRGSEDRRVASSQCVLFSNPNRCRSVLWVSSNITRKG